MWCQSPSITRLTAYSTLAAVLWLKSPLPGAIRATLEAALSMSKKRIFNPPLEGINKTKLQATSSCCKAVIASFLLHPIILPLSWIWLHRNICRPSPCSPWTCLSCLESVLLASRMSIVDPVWSDLNSCTRCFIPIYPMSSLRCLVLFSSRLLSLWFSPETIWISGSDSGLQTLIYGCRASLSVEQDRPAGTVSCQFTELESRAEMF